VGKESTGSLARPKRRLSKTAAEKLERCALASSRRARRSPTSRPAWSMLYIGLAGLSLCCARARHAEAVRSGRRQRSRVSSVLGQRAGRRDPIGVVCARACAVPGRGVLRGHDRRVGRWRGHVRVRVCGRTGRPWARERRPRVLPRGRKRPHGRRVPCGRSVSKYGSSKVGRSAGVPRVGRCGTV